MSNVWVCKLDGTIQCDENSKEITLDDMREQLASIIGENNIVAMEKRSQVMVQLCGMPTGRLNAYEISEQGWWILNHGIVGRQGFNPCSGVPCDGSEPNIGQIIGAVTAANPTTVRELIGHPLRVYTTGDALTDDWRPDRVNIEMSVDGIIVNIWFG